MAYCHKCGSEIKKFSKYCPICGRNLNRENILSRFSFIKTRFFRKLFLYILPVTIVIFLLLIFLVPTPYTAIEVRTNTIPYVTNQQKTIQEPYTDYQRVCTRHSFWTGDCTDYETQYVTKYRDKTVWVPITQYRDERNEVKVTKYASLWKRWTKQVDYYYYI